MDGRRTTHSDCLLDPTNGLGLVLYRYLRSSGRCPVRSRGGRAAESESVFSPDGPSRLPSRSRPERLLGRCRGPGSRREDRGYSSWSRSCRCSRAGAAVAYAGGQIRRDRFGGTRCRRRRSRRDVACGLGSRGDAGACVMGVAGRIGVVQRQVDPADVCCKWRDSRQPCLQREGGWLLVRRSGCPRTPIGIGRDHPDCRSARVFSGAGSAGAGLEPAPVLAFGRLGARDGAAA